MLGRLWEENKVVSFQFNHRTLTSDNNTSSKLVIFLALPKKPSLHQTFAAMTSSTKSLRTREFTVFSTNQKTDVQDLD